jgi:ubiquitin carboxyl-terminal hydrolase 9/24
MAKYVGLENPGCICYHNSLLQQLFMTSAFRNAITTLNLSHEEGDTKLEMLKSLKNLFFNLLYSEEIALNPVYFTKTIKSHDNKPLIKIFVQMDIDEFCSILFDKIEHQITFIPNQPNIVKNIFGGVYAHQIISK